MGLIGLSFSASSRIRWASISLRIWAFSRSWASSAFRFSSSSTHWASKILAFSLRFRWASFSFSRRFRRASFSFRSKYIRIHTWARKTCQVAPSMSQTWPIFFVTRVYLVAETCEWRVANRSWRACQSNVKLSLPNVEPKSKVTKSIVIGPNSKLDHDPIFP